MKASRFAIDTRVNGKKGTGTITKIVTKSTGYVEVTYDSGDVKKELAFNLTDMDGISLKATPKKRSSELTDSEKRFYASHRADMTEARRLDTQF